MIAPVSRIPRSYPRPQPRVQAVPTQNAPSQNAPVPDPQPQPNPDPLKGFRESLVGGAWATTLGAAVGGVAGALIGRGRGAGWGAAIGATLGQGAMQLITRFADGGEPKAAVIPGVAAAVGGTIGALVLGGAGAAFGLVAAPAAVLAYFYGARWLANRVGG